jgi:preprotein translocase subunit SecA
MGERFPEYDQWKAAGDREREEHRRQLEEVSGDPERTLLFALQKAKEYFSGEDDDEESPKPQSPPKQLGGGMESTAGKGLGPVLGTDKPGRNVGRNDPCPCGSGKKYKKCCLKRQGNDPLLN